jgi:hypothetical protein
MMTWTVSSCAVSSTGWCSSDCLHVETMLCEGKECLQITRI